MGNNTNNIKKKKSKGFFFNPFILLLNHFFAVPLLISYLTPYVSPENFWVIALLALAYPYLVIANLLFVIYWAISFNRVALYSLIIIVSGWGQLAKYFQLNPKNNDVTSKNSIKVMSYNVKLFDLYNWTNNIETRGKMLELIKKENPQILCIQEFFNRDSTDKFNNLKVISESLDVKYTNVEYTTTKRRIDHWGIAIFSSYPIINNGKINFEKESNSCIYSDMIINGDTVRVYNAHLQSNKLKPAELLYMDNVMYQKDSVDIEKSKSILRRLRLAYKKRANQAEIVAEHIKSSPYPTIVCGDFNDVPSSYTYNVISEGLKDAFVESGIGFGKTYARNFPYLRIDYILHSENFKSFNFKRIRKDLSDHYPIITLLQKTDPD